ncbi:MAG: hypothetical protein N2D54_12550, partial [Chloroflexota bacterium]
AEEIAARLDDRFQLLTGGSRTAMPRQQTLQALIEWSWNLLNEDEQALLGRLSVFSGSFTYAAAEFVGDPDKSLNVFEALTQLVRKSLITVHEQQGTHIRYRLLETIRHFATDKVVHQGEVEANRARHAEFFTNLVIEATPHIQGSDVIPWIYKLARDNDNLTAAIHWVSQHQPRDIFHYIDVLPFLTNEKVFAQNDKDLFRTTLEEILKDPTLKDTEADNLIRLKCYNRLVQLAVVRGDSRDASQLIEASEIVSKNVNDKKEYAMALAFWTVAHMSYGNPEKAVASARESLKIARGINDVFISVRGLLFLGEYYQISGLFVELEEIMLEINVLQKELKNAWVTGTYAIAQANLSAYNGNLDETRGYLAQAVELIEQVDGRLLANDMRSNLAHSLRELGHDDFAKEVYFESLAVFYDLDWTVAFPGQFESLALIGTRASQHEYAAKLLGAAEELRSAHNFERVGNEGPVYENGVKNAKGALGEEAFEIAFTIGRKMPVEEAVALALKPN